MISFFFFCGDGGAGVKEQSRGSESSVYILVLVSLCAHLCRLHGIVAKVRIIHTLKKYTRTCNEEQSGDGIICLDDFVSPLCICGGHKRKRRSRSAFELIRNYAYC